MELNLTFNGTPAQFGAACEAAAALLGQSPPPIQITISPYPTPLHTNLMRVRIASQDGQHLWLTVQRAAAGQTYIHMMVEATDWPRMMPKWKRVCAALQNQGWIMCMIPRGRLPS